MVIWWPINQKNVKRENENKKKKKKKKFSSGHHLDVCVCDWLYCDFRLVIIYITNLELKTFNNKKNEENLIHNCIVDRLLSLFFLVYFSVWSFMFWHRHTCTQTFRQLFFKFFCFYCCCCCKWFPTIVKNTTNKQKKNEMKWNDHSSLFVFFSVELVNQLTKKKHTSN